MFALRGLAVSFSVFVMIYGVLSIAVALTWRTIYSFLRHHPVHRLSTALFAVRMLPLFAAAVITAAFTVPSFLLLEPRSINEPMDAPLALGIFGVILGLAGLANAAMAMLRASRTISSWTREAEATNTHAAVPVLRIPRNVPAMTAAGILHPKVLVSASAEFLLNGNELGAALNHEVAHISRRDNLKKLLMRFVPFPGMRGLETAWLEATEMSADDAAVCSQAEALDLAAALIKLSRMAPAEPPADLTAALIHSPAGMMNARVERLIHWDAKRQCTSPELVGYGLVAAMVAATVFTLTYSDLLLKVHTATEWLMR
jgi:beta-lactamase regulating signal transducer with metallopeptidase domain